MPSAATNLTDLLEPAKVDMTTLHARFDAEMKVVRAMIGLIPNCDQYLEIWPPGFRTYNVIPPNFLNVPQMIWGLHRAPKDLVSLMGYAASRAAECMYCSAHLCTFALRRGTAADKVVAATTRDGSLNAEEKAVVDVGHALGLVPHGLTDEQRVTLRRHFDPDVVEWLVLMAAMMGFLNKVMDALGVELEQAVVDEIGALVEPTGWSTGKHRVVGPGGEAHTPVDSLGLKLSIIPHLPAAFMRDLRTTKGIPSSWPAIGDYFRGLVGYDFPVFKSLTHGRAIKAIGACIRMNLSEEDSRLGSWTKHLVAQVFALTGASQELSRAARAMASRDRDDVDEAFEAIETFVFTPTDYNAADALDEAAALLEPIADLGPYGRHALMVAKAAAGSPATITPLLIERHASHLPAPATVELVVWLGVLQMLYRLESFYPAV